MQVSANRLRYSYVALITDPRYCIALHPDNIANLVNCMALVVEQNGVSPAT